MTTHALRLYAGPVARRHIEHHGLQPQDVGIVPAAAGGPKGLILGPLDRFIFGDWLPAGGHAVHLVGASIGAWRMATACLDDARAAFERLERDYIAQHHPPPPGKKRPSPEAISEVFAGNLQTFYQGRVAEVLNHPRYRLHVIASRGRHLLHRDGALRTPLGYLGAFAANAWHRRALGAWLERVVFSSVQDNGQGDGQDVAGLPFATSDFRTRQVALRENNFMAALQASCSIPFMLRPVHAIEGAPPGCYWDGGITDYHLHLTYQPPPRSPIVLYPHFQQAVVPGWLDKPWRSRHRPSAALDHVLVLAPDPQWVRSLPGGKLPDRNDFTRFAHDPHTRMDLWGRATAEAVRLADEWARWLERPDPARVEAL
ncbi:MAG: phospholipase [Burkholderiaceae bacterium]